MQEFKITVRSKTQKIEETYQGSEQQAKRHATGLFNQLPFVESAVVEELGKEHLPRFMRTKWIKKPTKKGICKWVRTY